jgi:hypothetical protein
MLPEISTGMAAYRLTANSDWIIGIASPLLASLTLRDGPLRVSRIRVRGFPLPTVRLLFVLGYSSTAYETAGEAHAPSPIRRSIEGLS